MRRKLSTLVALLMVPTICSSCQFMPVEEELPVAPVIRSYEAKEYKLTTVMRGDLALTETVTCTYKPANKETLGFTLSGETVKEVYAIKGQQVKKGELLAELESGDLQEQIYKQEYELQTLESQKKYIEEKLQKETVLNGTLREDSNDKEDSNDRLVDLALELSSAKDAIYIKEKQLEESRSELARRQIRAGIDGTVTYARTLTDGQKSESGQIIFIVADLDTSVFIVEGDSAAYFPVGAEMTITYKSKEYSATVVEGSKVSAQQDPDKAMAYLELDQPDPTLESGANGKVIVTHDYREDVLFVNKKAVKTGNGEYFVYMLDEDGLRYMQYVSVGLENKDYIEITGGLTEGDSVVLE